MEHIVVDLKRTSGNVHFEAVSADHPAITVPFDFTPPLGSGDGLSGLEALVMTFCGCVSTAIVGLTLRLGKHIGSYAVRAEGERAEQPLSLQKIFIHIDITSNDMTSDDMDWVLRQAEAISPVWIAIQGNVAVETSYKILPDEK